MSDNKLSEGGIPKNTQQTVCSGFYHQKKVFSKKSSRIQAPGSSDLAAEVIKTIVKPKPLTDCQTSNAVRRGFRTLKYIMIMIMRHEASCHVPTGGAVTADRHHKCKTMQDNQGQIC